MNDVISDTVSKWYLYNSKMLHAYLCFIIQPVRPSLNKPLVNFCSLYTITILQNAEKRNAVSKNASNIFAQSCRVFHLILLCSLNYAIES